MAPYDTVEAHETRPGRPTTVSVPSSSGSRWWLWLLVIAVVVGGIWFYRSRTSAANSAGAAAPGAPGSGAKGGRHTRSHDRACRSGYAAKGDLPVFYNGLGSVNAFNTVTVRTRIDGQLIKVAFKEGQNVKAGDVLAEIDPRPYQVQLEQAEGQLAKDQAQLHDARSISSAIKLLYNEGVIPKQQVDTQQAQVGQFEGAIKPTRPPSITQNCNSSTPASRLPSAAA